MNNIFPKTINNEFKGSKIAIVIFFLINTIKFLMGLNISGLNPLISNIKILKEVDGIPLDEFPKNAAQLIIDSSANWALLMLIISLLGFVVLFRYRSMLPILFLIYFLEQIGRQFQNLIAKFNAPPAPFEFSLAAMINYGLTSFLLIGFILSIYRPFNFKMQKKS